MSPRAVGNITFFTVHYFLEKATLSVELMFRILIMNTFCTEEKPEIRLHIVRLCLMYNIKEP